MFRLARAAWRAAPAVAGTLGVIGAGVGASSVAHADALNKNEWRDFTLVTKRQVSPDTAEYTLTFPPGHEFGVAGAGQGQRWRCVCVQPWARLLMLAARTVGRGRRCVGDMCCHRWYLQCWWLLGAV